MAMGILAVFDMAGIDVGVNVHKANADRYPPDPTYYQADFALHAAGRLGQKNGKGYYRYEPGDRTRHDDPEAMASCVPPPRGSAFRSARTPTRKSSSAACIPLINEGIRILEEGIVQRASDIDVVWCAGYGFPRYRGGPLFYADTIGLKTRARRHAQVPRAVRPDALAAGAAARASWCAEGRTLADWDTARTGRSAR
jgi:3-hydroxyacyl-CoA dehydrogenase